MRQWLVRASAGRGSDERHLSTLRMRGRGVWIRVERWSYRERQKTEGEKAYKGGRWVGRGGRKQRSVQASASKRKASVPLRPAYPRHAAPVGVAAHCATAHRP